MTGMHAGHNSCRKRSERVPLAATVGWVTFLGHRVHGELSVARCSGAPR